MSKRIPFEPGEAPELPVMNAPVTHQYSLTAAQLQDGSWCLLLVEVCHVESTYRWWPLAQGDGGQWWERGPWQALVHATVEMQEDQGLTAQLQW